MPRAANRVDPARGAPATASAELKPFFFHDEVIRLLDEADRAPHE
jgi:hypothetical protein